MKILYTILLAAIGFACVIVSDFLLQKIPPEIWFGKFAANHSIRMVLSYLIGIAVFLIGIRVCSLLC